MGLLGDHGFGQQPEPPQQAWQNPGCLENTRDSHRQLTTLQPSSSYSLSRGQIIDWLENHNEFCATHFQNIGIMLSTLKQPDLEIPQETINVVTTLNTLAGDHFSNRCCEELRLVAIRYWQRIECMKFQETNQNSLNYFILNITSALRHRIHIMMHSGEIYEDTLLTLSLQRNNHGEFYITLRLACRDPLIIQPHKTRIRWWFAGDKMDGEQIFKPVGCDEIQHV